MKYIFKLLFAALFCGVTSLSFGQATGPSKFNYQAVIRDASGNAVANQSVDIRFQIFDASVAGNLAFQEDFTGQSTGSFGVVNIQIGGNGNVPIKSLNWGVVNYYVNIQMKQGGGAYNDIASSRTQLVSTPYALHAFKSDTAAVATSLVAGSGTPTGTIVAFGGTSIPIGWLLCDGQSYSNSSYPELAAAIGTNFGGSGSSFNVPDLRGRFLRGVDTRTLGSNDPDNTTRTAMNPGGATGATVGSVQSDTLGTHVHQQKDKIGSTNLGGNVPTTNGIGTINNASSIVPTYTNASGGSETRPVNAYANFIIKY